jgi:aldose 1-epimerase
VLTLSVRLFFLILLTPFAVFAAELPRPSAVERSSFGKLADGTEVDLFILTNKNGCTARVITFGATLTELRVPDRAGHFITVVRGTDRLDPYLRNFPAASVMGRVANRIANGRFTLDGHEHQLSINSPNGYHMHGGKSGFDTLVWRVGAPAPAEVAAVTLTHLAREGEDGYPGNLNATVTYTLTDDNTLRIDYTATTDKPTPVNFTNHAFFNLSNEGDLLGHEFMLNADAYTPVDEKKLPTGEIAPVKGTPFDFTTPVLLGVRLKEAANIRYDHNFVINRATAAPGALALCARVIDSKSGRVMETWTTEPGVQFLTRLGGRSSSGANGEPQGLFCLETQHYPNSVNHPHFPSTILRPGETFRSTTEYRFSIR